MVKKNKMTILDIIYDKYKKATNMTAKQLISWSKTSLSKKISLNRKPIMMAIRLKSKPKTQWRITEIKWALKRAIPYFNKTKKIRGKKHRLKNYTKNQLILKNWGFDVKK